MKQEKVAEGMLNPQGVRGILRNTPCFANKKLNTKHCACSYLAHPGKKRLLKYFGEAS